MSGILNFLQSAGIWGYAIIGFGLFAFALIVDRAKALFFDLSIKSDVFMKQVRGLIESDKIEEAVTYCAANQKKPLAQVIKRILERADRDESSMNHAIDVGISEVAPIITQRLGHLAMVANVATLLGLLGTIEGLIVAFKALAGADASQKQIMLAQGISIAMTDTALGLIVAIPVMIIFSFLNSRQNRIFSEIHEYSAKTVDLLKSRSYQPFNEKSAFPEKFDIEKPPVPGSRGKEVA